MLPPFHAELRIGTDPELRFTPNGKAVCSFRAVASSRKNEGTADNPNWVDDRTCWLTVTGFGPLAENMAESLRNKDMIVVLGRLEVRPYEDRDGNKRTSTEVLVDNIGPSLKWATAKVTQTERKGNGGGQQQSRQPSRQAADNDPWQTPAQDDEPPF